MPHLAIVTLTTHHEDTKIPRRGHAEEKKRAGCLATTAVASSSSPLRGIFVSSWWASAESARCPPLGGAPLVRDAPEVCARQQQPFGCDCKKSAKEEPRAGPSDVAVQEACEPQRG